MKLYRQFVAESDHTFNLPVARLVAHRRSVTGALDSCTFGNWSRSSGPLEVIALSNEPGKFQLTDGYHRLIELLLSGATTVPVTEIPENDYYAIARPDQRLKWNMSKPYKGLEALIEPEDMAYVAQKFKAGEHTQHREYHAQRLKKLHDEDAIEEAVQGPFEVSRNISFQKRKHNGDPSDSGWEDWGWLGADGKVYRPKDSTMEHDKMARLLWQKDRADAIDAGNVRFGVAISVLPYAIVLDLANTKEAKRLASRYLETVPAVETPIYVDMQNREFTAHTTHEALLKLRA